MRNTALIATTIWCFANMIPEPLGEHDDKIEDDVLVRRSGRERRSDVSTVCELAPYSERETLPADQLFQCLHLRTGEDSLPHKLDQGQWGGGSNGRTHLIGGPEILSVQAAQATH